MKLFRSFKLLSLLSVALLCGTSLMAQTNYGGVRGQVADTQGAAIANAKVTLVNQDTKVSHTDVTNDKGLYLFPALDPGTYTVTVAVTGFKTYNAINNVVTIGATNTIDATLQIGGTTETVEVTADSLVLNTASASGGQLFSEQQIEDLPSLGRNPFLLASLDANVVTLGDPRYVRAEDSTGSSQVSLGGAPSNSNSYAVDGIPTSTSSGGQTFIVAPEATANAKVQVDTFDAEVGRTGGGVFNASLKSGTATYHGVLYGETRQTPWSANTYFNYNNTPAPDNTTYLYSGAFGGPVPFSSKNRWTKDTFFWVTEEGYRQGQPNTGTNQYYVPTAAERNGDFSAYAPLNGSKTSCAGTTGAAGGACYIIYDPTTFPRVSYLTETGSNKIPTAALSPIGQYVANTYPAATNSSIYGSGVNYILSSMSFKTRSDEYIGKLEHTFFPWWTSQLSYLHNAIQEPGLSFLLTVNAPNTKLIRYFDSTAWGNTFTINPTTLLTVGFGFNRYYSAAPPYSTGFNAANGFNGAGFPSSFTSNVVSKTFPAFAFSNLNNSGSLGGSFGGPAVQASHNLVVNVSKEIKRHDVKFGYAYRGFGYYTSPQTGSAGSFTFTGQNTNSTGTSASANGVTAIADLLVGQPASATMQINAGPFFNKETYHSLFVQDDFRLNEKLTVNVGLRAEYELGQYEVANKFNVGFDPNAKTSYAGVSGPVNLTGGLQFAGVGGRTHSGANAHLKWSPRIGLAYGINKKTVLHAGYGFFYSPLGISTTATAGYSQVTSYSPGNTTGPLGIGANSYLAQPFTTGGVSTLLQPSGNTLGALTGIGGSLSALVDNQRAFPLVQQYLLDVQRELPGNTILKVSYVGAHASNFSNSVNINQIPNSALATAAANGTNLSTKVTNPLYATKAGGYPTTGVISQSTFAQGQFLLPFPQFTSVTVSASNGFSWYNSLAVKGEKHTKGGLTLLGTYTWSANWDNLYGTGSQVFNTYGPQDNTNMAGEYARSINSIPNRATLAMTYDLPFGRGKKFLNHSSGLIGHLSDGLLGGWQLNYQHVIQNGVPLSVIQTNLSTTTYGTTSFGGTYQRPTLVGDAHAACVSGSPQTRFGYLNGVLGRSYVNQAAFTATLPYMYGNTPRSLPCRAPGSDTATASLNKTFAVGERFKVQFRAEFLNLYNTPQFGYPNTTLNVQGTGITSAPTVPVNTAASPTAQPFGNLGTQIGFGRIIQMGGRISF